MPTPAFLDLTLYIPAGGVNGFELNGHAVNGVGFADNPFFGVIFELDPYRSILSPERGEAAVVTILPSLLNPEHNLSVQRMETAESTVWDARCESALRGERQASSITVTEVSLDLEIESSSFVPAEYRTAYVLADHPATAESARRDSLVDVLPPSQEPDTEDVSVVPAEDRTTKVPR